MRALGNALGQGFSNLILGWRSLNLSGKICHYKPNFSSYQIWRPFLDICRPSNGHDPNFENHCTKAHPNSVLDLQSLIKELCVKTNHFCRDLKHKFLKKHVLARPQSNKSEVFFTFYSFLYELLLHIGLR